MTQYHVPLIIRGRVIEGAELEFRGRRTETGFSTADARKHLESLTLSKPSALADLYTIDFEGILDYLQELGNRLSFKQNTYLQEAFELSLASSGLTEGVLRRCYETLGEMFDREFVRHSTDTSVGIRYLEGWVEEPTSKGTRASVRAFGARTVHVLAGNVPGVSSLSILRNAVTRGDAILKTPSNDPLTAAAIVRTMIDMAPDHPLTRHVSVAYWKGGDEELEEAIYQPRHVEKIVAWGGQSSISHIAKYIQPGIDLITLDPKLSSSIIGQEAFETDASMREAAERLAIDIGGNNQEACYNARVAYIQTGTSKTGLEKANRFGEMVFEAITALPSSISAPAHSIDPTLAEEVNALRSSRAFYRVFGGGREGAVIVSQIDEPVDFARLLANRVANLVPVDSLETPIKSVTSYTQTVGVYPDALKRDLRDRLSFYGAQRIVSLGYAGTFAHVGPHDGLEILRRMCKWIIEEEYDASVVKLVSRL